MDFTSTGSFERPPMIPKVCDSKDFVYCNDYDAKQYSNNLTLVAQLRDSLDCWRSHIKECVELMDQDLELLDRDCHAQNQQQYNTNSVCNEATDSEREHFIEFHRVLHVVKLNEVRTSFHVHFDRDEVLAVLRVLGKLPTSTAKIEALHKEVQALKERNLQLQNALEFTQLLAGYVPAGSATEVSNGVLLPGISTKWNLSDCVDAIAPLFRALRATWICCPMFGHKAPFRFHALAVGVLRQVEHTIYENTKSVVPTYFATPNASTYRNVKEIVVSGQDVAVTFQEQFFALKDGMEEAARQHLAVEKGTAFDVVTGFQHLAAEYPAWSNDAALLFDMLNWQYQRLLSIHQLIDVLQSQPDKIGSQLTDPIEEIPAMQYGHTSHAIFQQIVHIIETSKVTTPQDVLERIGLKAQQVAARSVPEAPVRRQTDTLVLLFEFEPPQLTIIGGPLRLSCLESIAMTLPACCSNTPMLTRGVSSAKLEFAPVLFTGNSTHEVSSLGEVCGSSHHHLIQRTTCHGRFCDDAATCLMFSTVLDLLEGEGWFNADSHAQSSGEKEIYTFFLHHRERTWGKKE